MEYKRYGNTVIIRLDRGEEIVQCLTQVCLDEDIRLGIVGGFGAISSMKVGVYDVANKAFVGSEYHSMFEIVSLTGNITTVEGAPYLHCHLAAAYEEGVVVGGHLQQAVVSATAELTITELEGTLERQYDEDTGLQLLAFD